MDNLKVGFSLEPITLKRIDLLAKATRRNKSAIVDLAIEEMAMKEEFAHLQTAVTRKQLAEIEGVRKGA